MLKEFKSLFDIQQAFPDEQACINHLEELRWAGLVTSPFDPTSKVYKCAKNRYRCKNTGKYFNVKTGTLFDNTKVKLQKWFIAIWLVTSHKKGISSAQLGRDIGVTQKTAWFMLQRIRKCFNIENDNHLDGDVEVDEAYIGGKNSNRHANKKVKNSQGRSVKDKTAVVGMVERNGKANAIQVEDVKTKTLTDLVTTYITQQANVHTDEYIGYNHIGTMYNHQIVHHALGEFANNDVTTNRVESLWATIKRGVMGIYHFGSKKHLQLYLDEFVFRFNIREVSESYRFNYLLSNMTVRTTYKELVYG
ncbi:IS1595 family transposase [Ligilactobacillus salivarius]|uniref:IS1595 family transposase n=1 Tax=Ligilactobacillus salivarius TaxID=1624 RepID=UPI000BAF06F8|nr:IS1595 family transposase [Ligilactobacillus salivarius]PAY47964.1 transposase [Ligilactobacillus salivarius]